MNIGERNFVRMLACFGMIPFVWAVIVKWLELKTFDDWWQPEYAFFYAAIILSFIGAIHWGRALQISNRLRLTYLYSIIPALIAWYGLMLEQQQAVFVIAYLLALFADYYLLKPDATLWWYIQLRGFLTFVVVTCLLLL